MTREEEIKSVIDTIFGEKGRTSEQVAVAKGFETGVRWADSTYVKGDIEKESELYAQGVVGELSQDVRHLLETAYIAGAKRIMK